MKIKKTKKSWKFLKKRILKIEKFKFKLKKEDFDL